MLMSYAWRFISEGAQPHVCGLSNGEESKINNTRDSSRHRKRGERDKREVQQEYTLFEEKKHYLGASRRSNKGLACMLSLDQVQNCYRTRVEASSNYSNAI